MGLLPRMLGTARRRSLEEGALLLAMVGCLLPGMLLLKRREQHRL